MLIQQPTLYRHEIIWRSLPRARPWNKRAVSAVRRIVVHRSDIVLASNGQLGPGEADCAQFYIDDPGHKWRGHPYHFAVLEDGSVWQTNALDRVTAGAKGFNTTSVHIRVRGCFITERPTILQHAAVAMLCSDLCCRFGFNVGAIVRHQDLHPWKQCPGRQFDMDRLRHAVAMDFKGAPHGLPILSVGQAWWDVAEK